MVLRFPLQPPTKGEKRRPAGRNSSPPDPFAGVLTYAGADYLLDVQLGRISLRVNFFCRLYTNEWFPARNDVLTDYVECTLPGYDYFEMLPAGWNPVPAPPEATRVYSTINFTFDANSGGTTIYGFILTNADGGVLVWAQAFQEPLSVPSMGTTLPLSVTWTDRGLWSH